MPFLTDGSVHYDGIKNEWDAINYMNENPNNTINKYLEKKYNSKIITWIHVGGTKHVMDALVEFEDGNKVGVSIKNHKSKTSTFDWLNTTMFTPLELINKVKKFKQDNIGSHIPNKGGKLRCCLRLMFLAYQRNNSTALVTDVLHKIYTREPATKELLINNEVNKCLILIDKKNNLDKYFNKENKHTFILKSSRKRSLSKQIWIATKDGGDINTHLRIRICLNNGITALLGQSKANSNSSVCIKIQQDNVSRFISECNDKVYLSY
tara:strand:- start:98 stop:892 length:795 start_codon:yes stop_codon:yes gene_type:complete